MCHGQRDLGDQITGATGHDRRSYDLVRAFLDVDFCEALVFAFEDRSIHVAEVLHVRVDLDAFVLRIVFVQSDMSNFRRCVSTPGNCECAGFFSAFEQGILNDNSGHKVSGMCKLIRRTDVASGVDHRIRRLHFFVDLDPFLVKFDSDAFKVQVFNIGCPSNGNQQFVDWLVVISTRTQIKWYNNSVRNSLYWWLSGLTIV